MKKVFLFVFSATLVAAVSNAQDAVKKKAGWGFVLGLNGSNLTGTNEAYSNWKTGLVAGFFVKIHLANQWSLQPELLYSSMGGKDNSGSDNSLRLNYFSLPVMVHYKLCQNFSVLAGPQIDVMITAKSKSGGSFAKVSDSYREDSYNLTGGVAYWPVHCFGLQARYVYGLNNISETSGMDRKNQGVQLTAAVKL